MTQDLIYYLQGYCYNVKIYAEYFVTFNKLELEQMLWSGLFVVWEPLPILVQFSFASTMSLCLSVLLYPRPQPPSLDVPNWISWFP